MDTFEDITYNDLLTPVYDPNYQNLLNETEQFFIEILEYGIYIMKEILSDCQDDKKPLQSGSFALLREAIEIFDGICVLIKNSCFDSVTPLVRNLFEIYIYVNFIFLEKKSIEEKLIVYHVQEIETQIYFGEKLEKKEKDVNKRKKYIEARNEYERKISNKKYLKYHNYFSDIKKRKGYIVNWYNYFGHKTLLSICRVTGDTEKYNSIYSILSNKSHGNASLKKVKYSENLFSFDGFRMPNNLPNLELSLLFLPAIYKEFITHHLKRKDLENYIIWYKNIIQKREQLLSQWKKLKFIEN